MEARLRIIINRPPAEVFAFISDRRNEPKWTSTAKHVDLVTPGPIGRGSRFHGSYKMFGDLDIDLTEYEPPRRLVFQSHTKSVDYRMEFVIETVSEGTQLVVAGEERMHGLMKLMTPLMALMRKPIFRSLGRGIKQALEQNRLASAS